jgi:uncharacterized protein (DUF433 family)
MPAAPEYIEVRKNRAGQDRPYVAGTRVRVQDIVLYHERFGQTPEEIVRDLPHLTLSQVHAALAYYFEDRDAIWACIHEDNADAEKLRDTLSRSEEQGVADAAGSKVSP